MDEYDYLEQQVDTGKAPAENGGPDDDVEEREKREERERRREKERKRSHKEKERERSRSRERRHRSSSRHEKDKDREREREREREKERERARRHDRDRDYGRGRDRERVEYRRAREKTPPEVAAAREKEKEFEELEKSVRTVMAMNLSPRAEEMDIFEFFAPRVGAILDVKIIRDKNTKRSKGIAYIEFATVDSAIAALSLNGQLMLNMPVLVKPSEAEKNLQWEQQQEAKKNQQAAAGVLGQVGGLPQHEPIKLQILNLHPEVSEDDLKELFQVFGAINYIKIVRDPMGASTGEAYLQFIDKPCADRAIAHFNGFEIAGWKMTVQVAPVYMAMPGAPAAVLPPPPGMDPAAMAMMGGAPPTQAPQAQVPGAGGEVDDLEEAETRTGFRLNAQSRVALMSRLAGSAGLQAPPPLYGGAPPPAAQPAAPPVPAAPVLHVPPHVLEDQGLFGPASPIPTPCLLLKNMFTDADKADPNWQADVVEDVTGEASKFGQVVHCYPDPNSSIGSVYIKFSTVQAAEAASRALHGRYYSGRQIVVSYQFVQPYNVYFQLH